MLKNRLLLGVLLSIFLLVFSIPGFTVYYKYTEEGGANFYAGVTDHTDALENFNEPRQILDDLGALLGHSKRDGVYPKTGPFGGTIQIPEAGLKFGNDPVNDDIAAYIAGEMMWQTKAELGLDLSLYYLKTEINTLAKVEAIYTKDIIDSDELAALKFTDLNDTPANYTGGSLKFVRVNVGETALEFAAEADPNVDTDAEIKAILVDEITKTGAFTAGRIAKINNATGIIEEGTNTDADVADAVTKKHTAGADTTLGTLTADVNMGTHKLTGLSVPSASGQSVRTTATITEANLEDAIGKRHTQNTDTAAGGEWDFGAHSAGFTIQTAGGDGTTTIDWTLGNYFKFTHGAMAETFTFNPAPTKPGHLTLIIIQDGVGGRDCTWPATVKWLGTEPTWTDGGAGKGILVAIAYDGTTYWAQGTPWEE